MRNKAPQQVAPEMLRLEIKLVTPLLDKSGVIEATKRINASLTATKKAAKITTPFMAREQLKQAAATIINTLKGSASVAYTSIVAPLSAFKSVTGKHRAAVLVAHIFNKDKPDECTQNSLGFSKGVLPPITPRAEVLEDSAAFIGLDSEMDIIEAIGHVEAIIYICNTASSLRDVADRWNAYGKRAYNR